MDIVVRLVSDLSSEELQARGLVDAPSGWPVDVNPYDVEQGVPNGWQLMTDVDLQNQITANQNLYDTWKAQQGQKVFTYYKAPVAEDRLRSEILASSIVTALEKIDIFGNVVDIYFKSGLSITDRDTLNDIVANHSGIPLATPVSTAPSYQQLGDFSPSPMSYIVGEARATVDIDKKTSIRGQILTDEGSFRDDFTGTSLFQTLTGTFTFSPNSHIVTAEGCDLSELVSISPYVRYTGHDDSCFTQCSIESYNSLSLEENYKGLSAIGTAITSNWLPTVSGNINMSVADSCLKIISSENNTSAEVFKEIDFLPVRLQAKLKISSRISGQTVKLGLTDSQENIKSMVVFEGTDSTKVKFITATENCCNEHQETTVKIPLSGTTTSTHLYCIEVVNGQCALLIDDYVVAVHRDHVPDAYDPLGILIRVSNESLNSASNTVECDWVSFLNVNQVDIMNSFSSVPVNVQLASPKTLDYKPIVSASARPIGTYTYLNNEADDQTDESRTGNGTPLEHVHKIGEALEVSKYFDVNAIINETHIHTALIQWSGANLDHIKCKLVPKVTVTTPGSNTNYKIVNGIIVMTAGDGDITVDWNNAWFVEMTPNEYNVTPPGYWDATYNPTTKKLENPVFNSTGNGQFNLFASEVSLFAFVPCFSMLGNGLYEIKSNDESRLGHNMRIKVTFLTRNDDHNWTCCAAVYLYRKKTI